MNTIKLALVSALSLTTINAHALDLTPKPYVGAELGALSLDYSNNSSVDLSSFYADKLTTASAYVGAELNDRLAIELGYINSSEKSKNFNNGTNNFSSDVKLTGFYADVIGKQPLTDSVKALASVGITHLKGDITLSNTDTGVSVSGDETETSFRFGLGGEYQATDSIDIRAMVRYMDTGIDDIDSAIQYAVGVNYKF